MATSTKSGASRSTRSQGGAGSSSGSTSRPDGPSFAKPRWPTSSAACTLAELRTRPLGRWHANGTADRGPVLAPDLTLPEADSATDLARDLELSVAVSRQPPDQLPALVRALTAFRGQPSAPSVGHHIGHAAGTVAWADNAGWMPSACLVDGFDGGAGTDVTLGQDVGAYPAAVDQLP